MKLKIAIVLAFFILACGYQDKTELGNEIVGRVEKFKSEKDRLPISLSEIGVAEKESGPIYYEKKSETKYILWFGKELGESSVYDSDVKQWK